PPPAGSPARRAASLDRIAAAVRDRVEEVRGDDGALADPRQPAAVVAAPRQAVRLLDHRPQPLAVLLSDGGVEARLPEALGRPAAEVRVLGGPEEPPQAGERLCPARAVERPQHLLQHLVRAPLRIAEDAPPEGDDRLLAGVVHRALAEEATAHAV